MNNIINETVSQSSASYCIQANVTLIQESRFSHVRLSVLELVCNN